MLSWKYNVEEGRTMREKRRPCWKKLEESVLVVERERRRRREDEPESSELIVLPALTRFPTPQQPGTLRCRSYDS